MKKLTLEKKLLIPLGFLILFLIWTALIVWVDVKPIGPEDTVVGFASLNSVFQRTTVRTLWYKGTQIIAAASIGFVAAMALLGLIEWIRGKYLWNVEPQVLTMGIVYGLVFLLYVFFSKCVINYRPIIMDGEGLEASYPSSHTMMTVTVLGTAAAQFKRWFRGKPVLSGLAVVVCILGMVIMFFARLISGVHWMTDMIGSVLLGLALVSLYYALEDTIIAWTVRMRSK